MTIQQFRLVSPALYCLVGSISTVVALTAPQASAQSNQPNQTTPAGFNLETLDRYLRTVRDERIATAEVQLDGRELFTIAAPTVTSQAEQPTTSEPVEQRADTIEDRLHQIVEQDFNPDELQVQVESDRASRLPILSINGQYLMTITTLDAQIHSSDLNRWADELTDTIEAALIRSRQEHQPQFLFRQAAKATAMGGAMVLATVTLSLLIRRLKAKHEADGLDRFSAITQPIDAAKILGDGSIPTALDVQQHLQKRQQLDFVDMQRRILKIGQVGVWTGGTYTILGLFPYSRWLQPWLISTPLQLTAIVLAAYLLDRLSDVLIDRLFQVVQDSHFVVPEKSQRLALRISTLTQVLKSLTTIVWASSSLLIALSVLGVDLVPLLAGVGIVGLAVSFAAQSVVKDVINGFFILAEDQYAVGDVIVIGEIGGLVENMNLRITQLRNDEGRLITIPNSEITTVQNLSKDWSRVDLKIEIADRTDPNYALQVMQKLSDELYSDRYWKTQLIDAPQVLGIESISHTGTMIRIWIKTKPLRQWDVAREFRRRLKMTMQQEGLTIGVPQQFLWFKDSLEVQPLHEEVTN